MIDLFQKYQISGPRYTSYPTLPHWDHPPTPEQWLQQVKISLENKPAHLSTQRGAALYIHIPFCQSSCTYCGCHRQMTRTYDVVPLYLASLLKEWSLYGSHLPHLEKGIPLSEIHLGGGTPTFLHPADLVTLIEGILSTAECVHPLELSIEVDPRVTHFEHLHTLSELGFKRLSLGIQDFDPVVQKAVNRIQSEAQVQRITDRARSLGFTSINYDLIYGLPFQTVETMTQTLEKMNRYRPDRIAFYSYAHVPWLKPQQHRFSAFPLPEGRAKQALYDTGRQILETMGYREIGMDHFALETDPLWAASQNQSLHRNFMGYTPHYVEPIIGLGVSAISDSWNMFVQNEKHLQTYQKRVHQGEFPFIKGHRLSQEDQIIRKHILNLMTQFQTDWNAKTSPFFPHAGGQAIKSRLQLLKEDGLITFNPQSIQVTAEGRPFLRSLCMAFDRHFFEENSQTNLFSQTI